MNYKERLRLTHHPEDKGLTPEAIQEIFRSKARDAILNLGAELLKEEVFSLCGKPFERKTLGYYRGGSAPTSIVVGGAKLQALRPRVKNYAGEEVSLPTLQKMQDRDLLDDQMLEKILRGVSTRNYSGVIDGITEKLGTSKSSVSRSFKRASQKNLDEVNEADLSKYEFVALVLDGSFFGEKTVVVAVGITRLGDKIPLGLKEGHTENARVVKDLLASIVRRGFRGAAKNMLALTDGSKALRSALLSFFGETLFIQRCWIHKFRNIKDYLPKDQHSALKWRMKKMMCLNSFMEAKKEYDRLKAWLGEISIEAENSLLEAGEDLLTLHRLGVTGELRKSLYTTNLIESIFGRVKEKTSRVKNWGYHPKLKEKIPRDKTLRWAATMIKDHRKKLRKIRGVTQIESQLVASLNDVDQLRLFG